MDPVEPPRVIEDLAAELAAVMAKYAPVIKASQLAACGIQLLWRIDPDPNTHIATFGDVPHA
jgi:hypothetical protein